VLIDQLVNVPSSGRRFEMSGTGGGIRLSIAAWRYESRREGRCIRGGERVKELSGLGNYMIKEETIEELFEFFHIGKRETELSVPSMTSSRVRRRCLTNC
jgi:hypothetical protein